MEQQINRLRKSEKLIGGEKRGLKAYAKQFPTMEEAAFSIGICRGTLHNILSLGSGSSESIAKIRAAINPGAGN